VGMMVYLRELNLSLNQPRC